MEINQLTQTRTPILMTICPMRSFGLDQGKHGKIQREIKELKKKKGDVSFTRLQELGGLHIGAKWKPYQCGEERTHKPFSLFVTDTHQMKFRSTAKSTHQLCVQSTACTICRARPSARLLVGVSSKRLGHFPSQSDIIQQHVSRTDWESNNLAQHGKD